MQPKGKKRQAAASNRPAKKRKVAHPTGSKKEKAHQRTTIPIPEYDAGNGSEVSDEDLEFFTENANAVQFLNKLDRNGIARSKGEIERLHKLHKPQRSKPIDDLPSIGSASDGDGGSWGSSEPGMSLSSEEESEGSIVSDSDEEKLYELQPRKRLQSQDSDGEGRNRIERLPIKTTDGRVIKTGTRETVVEEQESEEEEQVRVKRRPKEPKSTVATAARFGRPAPVDVISTKSRKARVEAAKEQIASICQDIIADPENTLGLLKRVLTFAQASLAAVHTEDSGAPTKTLNDPLIRQLALLSLLAVFKDIIPGYRIRKLTDTEKAEKVSQMVMRTREYEQGLVGVYQSYLQMLEKELRAKSELSSVSLKCLTTLLVEATHFNFSVNITSAIVGRLSKKSWDESSQLCLDCITTVFKNDLTGTPSLEVVRLLNRMIKERKFNVHPNVLSCLLSLRLKTELSVRSSAVRADKNKLDNKAKSLSGGRAKIKRAKGKGGPIVAPHLSKTAKKVLKADKEINKELQEASAEVDKEEKSNMQTETLKLLFVLYFSILKAPKGTPLLLHALQGISRFAHLVNVDFFKDILTVLEDHINRSYGDESDNEATSEPEPAADEDTLRLRLLCVITAFELLTGQGEALTVDLNEFVNHLYRLLLPLAVLPTMEEVNSAGNLSLHIKFSCSKLLFRALNLVLLPRFGGVPAYRIAAFAKRLLTAALSFPPDSALRAIEFVRSLTGKEPQLEAMLNTDERRGGGVYREDVDDPQLCFPFGTVFWELRLLEQRHWDQTVRMAARNLLDYRQSQ